MRMWNRRIALSELGTMQYQASKIMISSLYHSLAVPRLSDIG